MKHTLIVTTESRSVRGFQQGNDVGIVVADGIECIKAGVVWIILTWADLVFSIMLGTNDSAIEGTNGCPVAPERYYENMKTIINRLLALYPNCRIVVHRPLWYSPNTYNGAKYLEEGLRRLQDYYPQIQRLVDYYASHFPGQVFLGDTKGFDYFKENHLTDFQAEKGNAGVFYLHPNEKGAVRLGELWSEAIRQALGL